MFAQRPSGLSVNESSLHGRDLTRACLEPALDATAENRNDADEQHGNQSDEKPVFGDCDTVVFTDEPANYCANLPHRSPLSSVDRQHCQAGTGGSTNDAGEQIQRDFQVRSPRSIDETQGVAP